MQANAEANNNNEANVGPEADNIAALQLIFGDANVHAQLFAFKGKVGQLQQCEHVDDKVKSEFKYLYQVIENELLKHTHCNYHDTPQSVVLEHFRQLATVMINDTQKRYILNELQDNLQTLDAKLARKPPMSKKLKSTICGVIGAIVGAALGFVVGAAITMWAGGFGSLPAAIAGGALGFSIGIGVGATLGAAGGATLGFFHGKRKQTKHDTYENERTTLMKKVRMIGQD